MLLSDIELDGFESVSRDANFNTLGFLDDDDKISFLAYIGSISFIKQLSNPRISCLICKEELISDIPNNINGVIVSAFPEMTFWRIHDEVNKYNSRKEKTVIGKNCNISPLSYISDNNVVIGDNVTIDEFTSVYENTHIGNGVTIKSHCVIGAELEQRAINSKGDSVIANHYGGVVIGDNSYVESQALIARGLFWGTNTRIGANTIVGAKSFISHSCIIGNEVLIEGDSHIAGSSRVNDNAEIGTFCFVGNKLRIGKGAVVASGSRLVHDLPDNMVFWNNKLIEREKFEAIRRMVAINRRVE